MADSNGDNRERTDASRGDVAVPSPSSSAESSNAPEGTYEDTQSNHGRHSATQESATEQDDSTRDSQDIRDNGASPTVRTPRGSRKQETQQQSEETKEQLQELAEEEKKLQDGTHPNLAEKEQIFQSVKNDAIEKARIHRNYQMEVIENLFNYHKHAAEEIYKNSVEKVKKDIEDDIIRRKRKLKGERGKPERVLRLRSTRKPRDENHEEKSIEHTIKTSVDGGILRSDAVLNFSLTKPKIAADMQKIHSGWKARVQKYRQSCENDLLHVRVDKGKLYFCDQILQTEDRVIVVSELTAQEFFGVLFAISASDIVIRFPDGEKERLPLHHLRHGRFTIRKYQPTYRLEHNVDSTLLDDLHRSKQPQNFVTGDNKASSNKSAGKRRSQKASSAGDTTAGSSSEGSSQRRSATKEPSPKKASRTQIQTSHKDQNTEKTKSRKTTQGQEESSAIENTTAAASVSQAPVSVASSDTEETTRASSKADDENAAVSYKRKFDTEEDAPAKRHKVAASEAPANEEEEDNS